MHTHGNKSLKNNKETFNNVREDLQNKSLKL